MDSTAIRNTFLDFFAKKNHQIMPSAPLVPKDDPSLLFINSGMAPFKNYFLGHTTPPRKRIADTQLCLRVSGKHNDLDDVGFDAYHHTLFEMLGNWSFGDYFKKEAIAWAWELLTEVYKIAPDRLYVTVFGGDTDENLPADEEAIRWWEPIVGRERIRRCDKKDNFWEMGDTGPCGPCSEIHVDMRDDEERSKTPGIQLVNTDHPEVIEIWNLVFIQFNRLASGALEELPEKHVDTGMGFERLCRVIQRKSSNYDTDLFVPLIDFVARRANAVYGQDEKKDIAMRVIADHVRAVAFTVAEGQLPSNVGAGYVIRRILRRAVRYGVSYLNFKEPFMHLMVPLLTEPLRAIFPILYQRQKYVADVMIEEEKSFLRTLDSGLRRMEDLYAEWSGKKLDGQVVFELYDTYGFPPDLTSLIAREKGIEVDEKGFQEAMNRQKARSKSAATKEADDWVVVTPGEPLGFVGYDRLATRTRLLRYRKITQKDGPLYQLVFERTPCYAESGGQVGDTAAAQIGDQQIRIIDAKKENEQTVHLVRRLTAPLQADAYLSVDADRRHAIANNHTATHLMHAALRKTLGDHVEQRGSLVHEKGLRFDFSHFTAMTDEEVTRVERLVNERIRMDIALDEQRDVPIDEAKKMGAMALFGEKYGDRVRVITFDSAYSVELCGGTHVPSTGRIGFFKIVSESAVASGIRRIEAITAAVAERYVGKQDHTLRAISALLKHPRNPIDTLKGMLSSKQRLEKQLEALHRQHDEHVAEALKEKGRRIGDMYVIIEKIEASRADTLKHIAYQLRRQHKDLFLTLAAQVEGKPQLAVALGKKTEQEGRFHAGKLAKELAVEIGGGGGGQSFFAVAGGQRVDGLQRVIERAHDLVKSGAEG